MPTEVATLDALLDSSAATPEFRQALTFLASGRSSGPAIRFNAGAPPVKVVRVLSKLLEVEKDLEIREVDIRANSGCSDFAGTLEVNRGERQYDFTWDCAWRAKQEGWADAFGHPDQIRAAREFGYQCFERFERTR